MGSTEPQQFVVKGVNSGDTLVLLVPNKLPPVEKTVTLGSIECPKLAHRPQSDEEPYAWEAREFVRKLVIGKLVGYHHEYSVSSIAREFGQVITQDNQNLAVLLVREGLADVRKAEGQFLKVLEEARAEAKQLRKGKWSGDLDTHHVRNLIWDPPADIVSLADNLQGQTEKVLVEQVLNGGTLRVLLLPSHQLVTLGMTGLQCPAMRSGTPDPFAVEAKFFTERALLHREVNVLFEGYDTRSSSNPFLYGSIVQAGTKCFQTELLQRGLGAVSGWSIDKTSFAAALREAELAAKAKQINKWKNYVQPQQPAAPVRNNLPPYPAKVVKIISGDTLVVVKEDADEDEIKCTLASCKANKRGDETIDGGGKHQPIRSRMIPYSACAWASREFLRKLLVGQTVMVEQEYTREIEATKEVRPQVAIFLNSKNVSCELLRAGLARVVAGGPAQPRSQYIEDLKLAEAEAVQAKVGLHSPTRSPEIRMLELVKPGQAKCQQYLSFFQRGGSAANPPRLPAIVEVVLNPARFKVYIPSQKCMVAFGLTGVVSPSLGRDGAPSDPCAKEAFAFSRDHFNHHDAEVEVESCDQNGSFFGAMFVDSKNVALSLLAEGLASLNNNADRSRYCSQMKAAQTKASSEKKHIWASEENAPKDRRTKRQIALASAVYTAPKEKQEYFPCIVTEIVNCTHFFMQIQNPKTIAALKAIQELLQSLGTLTPQTTDLKAGDLVIARFTCDNVLYRAKVAKVYGEKVTVNYIDFGNSEQVGRDRVWTFPHLRQSVAEHPPLATPSCLAYLAAPGDEFAQDATLCLKAFCQDYFSFENPMHARVEYTDANRQYVMLKTEHTTAQEHLLRSGLARLQSRWTAPASEWREAVQPLERVQRSAKLDHLNIWQYGEVMSDDEEA
eukprot:NODE_164_length_2843_cov_20.663108_g152_i0.p1 GENE.NODE_164_length_2843_cov_20.663108_g152_i0~~NODE_164_length_2843_cov_20.663108_g152_i0.p1  ORF type:complete len:898 (+),score=283.33 NODE_164_length_2843_cov_20.663108_g152_i0:38-2731(+)